MKDRDNKDIDANPSEWNSDRHRRDETQAWDAIGGIIMLVGVVIWVAIFGR